MPAAMAAVRAGVPRLGLIDPDPVELSNLHRQVIYAVLDIGTPKVTAAERRLREAAPSIEIETYRCELNATNARSIIESFDFTIDATDSPLTKFLINDTCVALGRRLRLRRGARDDRPDDDHIAWTHSMLALPV